MDLLERFLVSLVHGANAIARPVAFSLNFCFALTYAAHLYRHRDGWARGSWARSLLLFPLRGGKRHAVFQVVAWGLWCLSAAISLPIYLSLLAARSGADDAHISATFSATTTTTADSSFCRGLLTAVLGLRRPLIPPTHMEAASGAAAVSSLWGELFLLKALLVFEGAGVGAGLTRGRSRGRALGAKDNGRRQRKGVPSVSGPADVKAVAAGAADVDTSSGDHLEELDGPQGELLAPSLASLLVCLMGMALSVTGFVLLLALEHMPDTASRVLYCCLALSCVFIGASSTHGLGGHLRHCAGAAGSAGAALGVLRRPQDATTGAAAAAPANTATSAVAAAAAGTAAAAVNRRSTGSSSSRTSADSVGSEAVSAREGVGGAAAGGGPAGPQPQEGSEDGETEEEEDEVDAEEGPGWHFFQPFQGGSVFVATQAVGWTLFSSTVVAVLLLAKQLVAGVGYCLRCWALAAGALMMATQLVLGASLLTYQQRRRARNLLQPVLHHPRASFARAAGLVMPVVMMYLPLHVSCSAAAAMFVLLPRRQALAAVAAVLVPYFAMTLRGYPAHTGCRRWEWLCRWFSREVEGSLAWWAGRLEVVRDFPGTAHEVVDRHRRREAEAAEAAEAAQAAAAAEGGGGGGGSAAAPALMPRRYVLGFHPHGLYPTGAGFVPLMPSVQAAFPGTSLVTLTASIVHYLPGLRDIAGWAGFRQVTRATFRRALHDTGGVLLCPGGQAELVYADRAFPPRGSPAAAAAAAPAPATSGSGAAVVVVSGCPTAAAAPTAADVAAAPQTVATTAASQPSVLPSAVPQHPRKEEEEEQPQWQQRDQQQQRERGAPHEPPVCRVPRPTRGSAPGHQLVIYAGHQGFVRLALEEGAWLVPVLALGETLQLRNLISAPEMQRATYKRLGFPVPFILAGRWGLTTLPLKNPLVYVLGAPLPPPPGWEAERQRQLQPLERSPPQQRQGTARADGSSSSSTGGVTTGATKKGVAVVPCGGGGAAASTQTAAGLRRRRRQQTKRQQPAKQAAVTPTRGSLPLGSAPGSAETASSMTRAGPATGPEAAAGQGAGAGVVVPQAVVDEYHARFYTALADLWVRHHHRHPVLQHAELVFEWGHHHHPQHLYWHHHHHHRHHQHQQQEQEQQQQQEQEQPGAEANIVGAEVKVADG